MHGGAGVDPPLPKNSKERNVFEETSTFEELLSALLHVGPRTRFKLFFGVWTSMKSFAYGSR